MFVGLADPKTLWVVAVLIVLAIGFVVVLRYKCSI